MLLSLFSTLEDLLSCVATTSEVETRPSAERTALPSEPNVLGFCVDDEIPEELAGLRGTKFLTMRAADTDHGVAQSLTPLREPSKMPGEDFN